MARTPRKSLRPSTRFEVFQRDGFQCQYCGRLVPDVTLEADHIMPVSKGGTDDPLNLITSCHDCNIGKGVKQVSVERTPGIPSEDLTERRLQIAAFYQYQRAVEDQVDVEVDAALAYWDRIKPTYPYEPDRVSIRRFMRMFGYGRVVEAMDIAWSSRANHPERYMFGVLHNWRREKEGYSA